MKERCDGGQAARGASKLPYEGAWYRITPDLSGSDRHVVFVIAGNFMPKCIGKPVSGSSITCCSIEDTRYECRGHNGPRVRTDMMLERHTTFFDMISIIPQLMIFISSSKQIQVR